MKLSESWSDGVLNLVRPMAAMLPKSVICLRNYNWQNFSGDLFAGVTVGLVALPLAMALPFLRAFRRKLEFTQPSWPAF